MELEKQAWIDKYLDTQGIEQLKYFVFWLLVHTDETKQAIEQNIREYKDSWD